VSGVHTWQSIGLSEQAVMDALCEDGLLPTSERDDLVRVFRESLRLVRVGGGGSAMAAVPPRLCLLGGPVPSSHQTSAWQVGSVHR
jgi:hypothetical protein